MQSRLTAVHLYAWSILALACLSQPAWAWDYIVESRTNGQNFTSYREMVGWMNSSAKSAAPGCTAGIGCRYRSATQTGAYAEYSFTPPTTAVYEIAVTWDATSYGTDNVSHEVRLGTQILASKTFNQNSSAGGADTWNLIATLPLQAGQTYTVRQGQTHTINSSLRLLADAVRFHTGGPCMSVPAVALDVPVLAGDTSVTVTNIDPQATAVSVYSNSTKIAENTTSTGGTRVVTVPGLTSGATVWPTQTINGQEGCLPTYSVVVGDCAQVPAVTRGNVLVAGSTQVVVAGVLSTANQVVVRANGVEIGANSTPVAGTTVVTVSPLIAGQSITAKQILRGLAACNYSLLGIVGDPAQVPAVSVVGLVDAGRTAVRISSVSPDATSVKVYANNGTADVLIGTNNSPSTGVTVVNVSPLLEGQIIKAVQAIVGLDGMTPAAGRRVTAAGIVEDFEGTVTIQDNPDIISGGQYRVWYDVMSYAYSDVLGPADATRGRLFGSKCINVTDHGWDNGAYSIYEQIIPEDGTYHVEVDMLIDEPEGLDYDFYRTYQVGVVVNGAHRDPQLSPSTLPPVTSGIAGSYPCPSPQRDGTTETAPIRVSTATFNANAGDSLMFVFSTDLNSYEINKTATPAGYIGMKIDNIKLVAGPAPASCTDLPVPTITATPTAPLEAGRKLVAVQGILAEATSVTVYANGLPIGTAPATGQALQEVAVTTPLVAGQKMSASQTVGGVESCLCPLQLGLIVGAGPNSPLEVGIGIRETGQTAGVIGSDGGSVGPIEWVGVSAFQQLLLGGKPLSLSPGWQTITFSSSRSGGSDPLRSFTGNGVLDGAFGTLEHIAFTLPDSPNNAGRYVIYIDSIYNGDVLLADFDDPTVFPAGSVAMFRNPSRSGSTDEHLLPYPNIAAVDDTRGADGSSRSYRLEFQFLDTDYLRWVRITSVGGAADAAMPLQNPLIDLTKPITIKFLLAMPQDLDADADVDADDFRLFVAAVGRSSGDPDYKPDADVDRDGTITQVDYYSWLAGYRHFVGNPQAVAPLQVLGDFDRSEHVDEADFTHFQSCANGPGLGIADEACRDADLDLDADVDQADFAIFQRCITGPDLAINLACSQ